MKIFKPTIFFLLFSQIIFLFPFIGLAADYTTLAPVPGIGATVSTNDLSGYLNAMFKLGISLAVGLAVIMIIIGGIQYMSTDAMGKKNDGKSRITAAIVGLLVALGSYMLLNTLDPNLLKTELTLQSVTGGRIPLVEEDIAGNHYTYYSDGTIDERTPNGSVNTYINENNEHDIQTPPPLPVTPVNNQDAQKYKDAGCIPTQDRDDHSQGYLTPMAAYINDNASNLFPGTSVISTFRSQAHNTRVGGSKTSQHMHGNAADIADSNNPSGNLETSRGLAIVNWAKQNGQSLGIRQIIFQNTYYNSPDGVNWTPSGGAHGHDNHVHIGGGRDGNICG